MTFLLLSLRGMNKFFSGTFGFTESVDAVYSNIDINETKDGVIMHSKANGKTWNSGIFQVLSSKDIPTHKKRGGGTLNIIKGNGRESEKYWLVDILPAQSHPSNDGATYLAASNFNALEYVSASQTARDGISGYPYDRTQGPYCAIACGPSILYRNYFVSVPGSRTRGQLDKEINLLEDTPIKVVGGYAQISEHESHALAKSKFKFNDLTKYKVASHKNCEVTMSQEGYNFVFPEKAEGKRPQIAHHVYAAAFNMAYDVVQNDVTLDLSRSLLEAEYRNTILCAWDNSVNYPDREGSKKLYLTLLGGGVFGNPIDLICEQIAKCQKLIVDSGLEVYVVCFNEYVFSDVYPHLKAVMEKTNGKVIEA